MNYNSQSKSSESPSSDAVQELDTSESKRLTLLFLALESTGNGLVITDPNLADNPIIHANQVFTTRSGFEIDQIIGKNCRFLQQGDRDQIAINEVRNAIREQRPVDTTFRNYRKGGGLFYTELTISPVHDARGRLLSYVGVQYDVSARKEAERRVSECYAVLSHELRTPVTSISAALAAIDDGAGGRVTPRAKNLLKTAVESCDRLTALIAEILDWKKIESGQLSLNKKRVRTALLLEGVVSELRTLAIHSRVLLSSENPDGGSVTVDRVRIMQVLVTLVTLAIRNSPIEQEVVVRCDRFSNHVTRFSVTGVSERPAGETINASQSDLVQGNPFDLADMPQGGIGLELAICSAVIELHGGMMGVSRSSKNETSYWFDIIDKQR